MFRLLYQYITPLGRFFTGLYYSLPVQLVVSQLRSHRSILLFWVLLILINHQAFLKGMGSTDLILEPDYMNQVSWLSMFFLGVSIGVLTLAYQMTMYILDGYKFYFLVLEKNTFFKFAYNNSLIPIIYWTDLLVQFYRFHSGNPQADHNTILMYMSALIAGGFVVTTSAVLYFNLSNNDIFKYLSNRLVSEFSNPRTILRRARQAADPELQGTRVDYYLNGPLSIRRVKMRSAPDFRSIVRTLNQNHRNAVLAMLIILVTILVQAFGQENPRLQFPAGAAFMLLFSFAIMISGAFSFWFRKVGLLAFLTFALLLFLVNRYEGFKGKNMAFGLDYVSAPAAYSEANFASLTTEANYQKDYQETLSILEKWKANYYHQAGQNAPPPKLLILCVTGGGNRSSAFTMRCLQYADSLTNGKMHQQMRLITGASGGINGAVYFRELLLQQQQNPKLNIYQRKWADNSGKDLLNPIMGHMVVNLFLPNRAWEVDGNLYFKDRGYAWEQAYMRNTGVFEHKTLGDYAEPERQAKIPMLLLTPSVMEDGRRMIISPLGVSYLCKPLVFNDAYRNEFASLEFRRLFAGKHPERLHFTTAIRTSCTFPTFLPFVALPTSPEVSLMDAGAVDNYGANTAVKFVYVFRGWIQANTSGVVLLQIRDSKREIDLKKATIPPSFLARTITGVAETYGTIAEARDNYNDDLYQYARSWFQGSFDVVELQYIPQPTFEGASLSFHISEREKRDIFLSLGNAENQKSFATLKQLLDNR
jgi:hypothetical protein